MLPSEAWRPVTQVQLLPPDPQFLFRLTFECWWKNTKTGVSEWNRVGAIHYYSSDDNGDPPALIWETANRLVNRRYRSYGPVRAVVKRYALHADISKDYPNGNLPTPPVASTP
jgi:hypothetical protein